MKKIIFLIFSLYLITNINSKAQIVENNNEFAFEIFKQISASDTLENVFLSPFSISTALSMAYDGAAGNTAKEMRKVLRFTKNQKFSHNEFTGLLKYYRNSKQQVFKTVNAAFAQEKYNFLQSYLNLLKNYDAIIKTVDFRDAQKREIARREMNKWVSENTEKKIEELIDKNSIDDLTRLVLINAIYFKADWKYKFDETQTRQMIFQSKKRQYITAFMHMRENMSFYQSDKIVAIALPYADDVATLYVIMPVDENIDGLASSFSYKDFVSLKSELKSTKLDFFIPKIKIESRYKLKDVLIKMGMVEAFTSKANFKKMNGRSDLMIDDVIHQAFIETDENGTEAAAATAVVVREKSAPQIIYVNFNKPFIFVIQENNKGSILFIGKFIKPFQE
ncbi:MAG: serpin family protein [Bacteroidales bacterium]|jgi:serpin B